MSERIADGKSLYVVTQDPAYRVAVAWVPGHGSPVKLSLVTRDHRALGTALEADQSGANLEICMGKEAALEIFAEIRRLARTMDWPLPKEDEDLA